MPSKNKSQSKIQRAAQIQGIIEEVRKEYDSFTNYAMLSHACPDCGGLAYYTVLPSLESPFCHLIIVACDDDCGWEMRTQTKP